MSSLPPSKNISAPSKNGEVTKRAGTEKAIEDSMRMWHNMREERDDALNTAADLRIRIVELETTNAVLLSRNQDLEKKNEQWLIELTTMRTKLEYIGQLGDSISLGVHEILHGPASQTSHSTMGDTLSPRSSAASDNEILPHEGETIPELARRLVQDTDHLAAAEAATRPERASEWPNSNSQSPTPSSSTPTNGPNQNSIRSTQK